jgi:hypothetical protein
MQTAPPPAGGTLTELVSGIIDDTQRLIKQQVEMVRSEIHEDFRKTKDAAKYIGIGAGIAAVGGFFLLVSVALLLPWLYPQHLPEWSGFAIVGGLLALGGGIAAYVGQKKFAAFNPLPDKSFDALQETVQWLTNGRK